MALATKIILVLLLGLSIAFSAWLVALPVLGYLAWTIFHRKPVREAILVERQPKPGSNSPKRYLLGLGLLALSLVALSQGGRVSVAVLAALGGLAIFGGSVRNSSVFGRVEPVDQSILLKRTAIPFGWLAVVEVKLAAGKLAGALSHVEGKMILKKGEKTGVYIVLQTFSLSRDSAERALAAKMRRLLSSLAPVEAYLLPLDSKDVAAMFSHGLAGEKVKEDDWPTSFKAAAFEVIVMRAAGGFLEAVGFYTRKDNQPSPPSIPTARQHLRRQPLLLETLETLDRMVPPPEPDSWAAFLASVYASRSLPVGQVLQTQESSGTALMVKGMTPVSVKLTRSQLRTIARVYGLASANQSSMYRARAF